MLHGCILAQLGHKNCILTHRSCILTHTNCILAHRAPSASPATEDGQHPGLGALGQWSPKPPTGSQGLHSNPQVLHSSPLGLQPGRWGMHSGTHNDPTLTHRGCRAAFWPRGAAFRFAETVF